MGALAWLCTLLGLASSALGVAMDDVALDDGYGDDPCRGTVMLQTWQKYGGRMRPYTSKQIRADFPQGRRRRTSSRDSRGRPIYKRTGFMSATGLQRAAVGDGQLRTKHPKGCVGTRECGLQFDVRLPGIYRSATFSYWFRFSNDYNWTAGGKMPGVCSENCPSGCRSFKDGYSARVMWRRRGALASYMYYPGKQAKCGVDWNWGKRADSKWRFAKVYVRMNDPGKRNGVHRVWLDGKRVYNKSNAVYRRARRFGVERFTFRNFHGGKSAAFRPNKTQYNWFADVRVEAGQCPGGPMTPRPKISPTPRRGEFDVSEEFESSREDAPGAETQLDQPQPQRQAHTALLETMWTRSGLPKLLSGMPAAVHNVYNVGRRWVEIAGF